MRLIDADALKEADFQDFSNTDVFSAIDREPSIDPVRYGRWKDEGFGDYRCSWCDEAVSGKSNYCRNCGAKMHLQEDYKEQIDNDYMAHMDIYCP